MIDIKFCFLIIKSCYVLQNNNIVYWACERRRSKVTEKCNGRGRTQLSNNNHSIITTSEHNHLPDALEVETSRYRETLKRKAQESNEKPEKIIRYCAAQAPLQVTSDTLFSPFSLNLYVHVVR